MRDRLSIEQFVNGVVGSDTAIVARLLTLLESRLSSDQEIASQVLARLPEDNPSSIRIGLTGIPGSGKSTLLNAWIPKLATGENKVAVLAIDPSSPIGKGSILGDKTRMQHLNLLPNVFVRPSPSLGVSGGAHFASCDAIRVLEAAGYNYLFIETVGVGQNETEVRNLTDLVVLLWIHGTGDELQLLKRGITEIVDIVVLNKTEEMSLHDRALRCQQISDFLQLPCFPCSAFSESLIDLSLDQLLKGIKAISPDTKALKRTRHKFDLFKELLIKEFVLNLDSDEKLKAELENFFQAQSIKGPSQAAQAFWKEKLRNSFFGA
jgi:LAO/AO transport system ATPase